MRHEGSKGRGTARIRVARLVMVLAALGVGFGVLGTEAAAAAAHSRRTAKHAHSRHTLKAAHPKLTVKLVKHGTLGDILVTANGMTVYIFTGDTANKPTCTGGCASLWPPVTVAKGVRPRGGRGVVGLGTVLNGGKHQVTWHKHPLYTYSLDTHAGAVNGNGIAQGSSTWWAATKKRASLASSSTPRKSPPTTTSGSPGYGYGY